MANVGIMSMQRIANYGSFLQAYALKNVLEKLGHTVNFVDYRIEPPIINSKSSVKSNLSKTFDTLLLDAPLHHKLRYIKYKKTFSNKYLQLLEIKPEKNYTPELDVLLIGSDEVFNIFQENPNVGYSLELLGSANKAKRLIAYAASFGNTTYEKIEHFGKYDELAEHIQKFDAISVRDKNSATIVQRITGRQPNKHPDPCLIYDFKKDKNITEKKTNQEARNLLLYAYTGRISKSENRAISEYTTKHKLKIDTIGGIHKCADRFISCSPFEVLAYFKQSAAVITDTFHGTIFSLITHCPFAVIIRDSQDYGYGNREKLIDLLETFDLTNRTVTDINNLEAVFSNNINWMEVDSKTEELRQSALSYLVLMLT